MTEIVESSSISSEVEWSPTRHDGLYQNTHHRNLNPTINITTHSLSSHPLDTVSGDQRKRGREEEEEQGVDEYLKFLGLFLSAFRRSVFGCSSDWVDHNYKGGLSSSAGKFGMEIGLPTDVRHVAHVTFDRFNGFLGLPAEFEPQLPTSPPSASAKVFGVSTNSMQLSFDGRGNSVPTILLLMQYRLYALGGLQVEGIFRINAENGQEEYVRDELNRGVVPEDVDIHCLAGLIKAWFRELPTGILDSLSPEEVMQSQTEEECTRLARLLPPTEFALLDWAINLMADVAQFQHLNKMNARNVAMVFAPNMTHMADALTALMHAVQVMNFLKTLIEKTLREREDSMLDSSFESSNRDPSGGNDPLYPLPTIPEAQSNEDYQTGDDDETKENKITSAKTKTAKKGSVKTNVRVVTEKTKRHNLINTVNLRTPIIDAWR